MIDRKIKIKRINRGEKHQQQKKKHTYTVGKINGERGRK